MRITLNKRLIENIIRESLNRMLKEAQGLNSQKLYDIFQQYGGKLDHYVSSDLHNLTDDDIIGVLSYDELHQILRGHNQDHGKYITNNGLDIWAEENGYNLDKGDKVSYLQLNDRNHYLVYVDRNAEFEHSGREGGWKDYYDKTEKRRKSRIGVDQYNAMTPKGRAAKELRTNPYFRTKQGGWKDDSIRQNAIDNARQGKDAWGLDA